MKDNSVNNKKVNSSDVNDIKKANSTSKEVLKDSHSQKEIAEKNKELIEKIYRSSDKKVKEKVLKQQETVTVLTTLLVLVLVVGIIIAGIFIYLNQSNGYDENFIRVSVDMVNTDEVFFETDVNGETIPKQINPGDSFNLSIVSKNSKQILGDSTQEVWANIYLRFKIYLLVDGVVYEDLLNYYPNSTVWQKYDKATEDQYLSNNIPDVPVSITDDGYYYCNQILVPNQEVVLISDITFNQNITREIANKQVEIVVKTEVLEAQPGVLYDRQIWQNAPYAWVGHITSPQNIPSTPAAEPNQNNNLAWLIPVSAGVLAIGVGVGYVFIRSKSKKKG